MHDGIVFYAVHTLHNKIMIEDLGMLKCTAPVRKGMEMSDFDLIECPKMPCRIVFNLLLTKSSLQKNLRGGADTADQGFS